MATLRKRGTKWQVQIRRNGHKEITKSFLLRDHALKWSREIERKIDTGMTIEEKQPSAQPRMSDLINRYVKDVSSQKRSGMTEAFYFKTMHKHEIAEIMLKDLKPADICAYRDARLKQVSTSTVRNEMALLLHALKIARNEWGWTVKDHLLTSVKKPPPGKPRTRRLEEGEFLAIMSAIQKCQNSLMQDVFLFALATGMRRGEVLALQWQHIDIRNNTAFLPKTKNGDPRTVPLSAAALNVLAKHRIPLPSQERAFPISANAVRLAWEGVKKRAGIENLRFHDLRHEAISRFFEMGLSVPEVALISGHKDARMLFRYTHLKAADVAVKLSGVENQEIGNPKAFA